MQRAVIVERIRRLIYNGMPPQDSEITENMVNSVLNDAIAASVKQNWFENIKIDGCACVNNSFYSTFSNLTLTSDDEFGVYNVTLPSIPPSLGKNEAINAVYVIDDSKNQSRPAIMLSANQVAYTDTLPQMNGILAWNEGSILKLKSPKYPLLNCKAKVRMVSTGSTDLNSEINLSDEFFGDIMLYVRKAFAVETTTELVNDGIDSK